jgi:hypothetical protein
VLHRLGHTIFMKNSKYTVKVSDVFLQYADQSTETNLAKLKQYVFNQQKTKCSVLKLLEYQINPQQNKSWFLQLLMNKVDFKGIVSRDFGTLFCFHGIDLKVIIGPYQVYFSFY